jgi:hypothetical protein
VRALAVLSLALLSACGGAAFTNDGPADVDAGALSELEAAAPPAADVAVDAQVDALEAPDRTRAPLRDAGTDVLTYPADVDACSAQFVCMPSSGACSAPWRPCATESPCSTKLLCCTACL